MAEISERIEFSKFTGLLEALHKAASVPKRAQIFSKYYASFQEFQQTFQAQGNSPSTFYPILRLLLPELDRERPAYGIKTNTLGRLIVRILAIDQNSDVAKRLTRKDDGPNHVPHKPGADYASVVYEVMKNRAASSTQLTVSDVNQRLDNIAQNNVSGSRKKETEEDLIALFNGMTALDQKWLIRIILKQVRVGLGTQKIFSLLRTDAGEIYARHSSLLRLCESLCSVGDFDEPFSSVTVAPGRPFLPMLCERVNVGHLDELIAAHEYFVETKMDGERFQIHIDADRYHYFSRRGFDYTSNFGGDITTGTLSPDLAQAFKIPVSNCILDGEMMVWNRQEEIFHIKAEHTDVKSLHRTHPTLRPAFCVYDVLHLNDVSMLKKPYAERVRLLKTLIRERSGVITLSQPIRIRDAAHIVQSLNEAFENREEGVVIKRADSEYHPGQRKAGWCKIKPDYIDGMVTDFDMIVLGGYVDRTKTRINKFLVGVYDKQPEQDRRQFLACGTVNLGLTHQQFVEVNAQLRPHWNMVRTTKSGRTTNAVNPPKMDLGAAVPDIWIDPCNSIIFEIKASELVVSSSYATKYSLRFPRIQSIRRDKAWFDCCTLEELQRLCAPENKVQKLTKRQLVAADIGGGPLKAKRLRSRLTKIPASQSDHQIEPTVALDNICAGLDFCVLNTNKNNGPSVRQLEAMIRAHGGNVVSNQTPTTFICIAASAVQQTLRVSALCKDRSHNIATVEWLVKALGGNQVRLRLEDFQPSDMICCTPELEQTFSKRFDAYGDSYVDEVDSSVLANLLDKIDVETLPEVSRSEMYELEQQLAAESNGSRTHNFYRLATAHFGDGVPFLARWAFQWRGGRVVSRADVNDATIRQTFQLSHAIVDGSDSNDLAMAVGWDATKCVSYEWILDSHTAGRKISDKKYLVSLRDQ